MMVKLCILFFVFASCSAERRPPSPAVRKYLEEVVSIMQANSVNRAAINWVAFKQNLLAEASGAKTIEQAYPAVVFAIVALGDKHSFFVPARPMKGPEIPTAKQPPLYLDEPVPGDIGYIRIPWVVGSQEKLDAYITSVQAQIKERDKLELKGWLVDLRGNMGGNMWPMLVGAGPVLGEDTLGYFLTRIIPKPRGDTKKARHCWTATYRPKQPIIIHLSRPNLSWPC